MAERAIMQIKEAEEQAKASEKNALEEANQIIRRTEEETADAFLSFIQKYERQESDRKQQAEETIRKSNDDFSKETVDLCAALKQKMASQKAEAVDAVIQMVLG